MKLNIGFAETDITPEAGEELAGYGLYLNRRAKGRLDALKARVMTLDDGAKRVLLIQMDLIGVDTAFVEDLRCEAQKRWGVLPTHLMVHCSHTHSGPTTYPYLGCGRLCVEYLGELSRRILQTVDDALQDLREMVSVRRYECDCRRIGYTRAGSAEPDSILRGLVFEIRNGPPVHLLNYACHPVVLGRNDMYSADYPGRIIAELNAYGVRGLFLNGPCGDIDPLSNSHSWGAGTSRTLDIYGRDIAEMARRWAEKGEKWTPGELRCGQKMCEIQGVVPGEVELDDIILDARGRLAKDPTDGVAKLELAWSRAMNERRASCGPLTSMVAETQVISMGEVAIVGFAAELFTDLGRRIRSAFPDKHLLMAATTNGLLGYIATRDDAQECGYASSLACKIYGMAIPKPGEGERFVKQSIGVIASTFGC